MQDYLKINMILLSKAATYCASATLGRRYKALISQCVYNFLGFSQQFPELGCSACYRIALRGSAESFKADLKSSCCYMIVEGFPVIRG